MKDNSCLSEKDNRVIQWTIQILVEGMCNHFFFAQSYRCLRCPAYGKLLESIDYCAIKGGRDRNEWMKTNTNTDPKSSDIWLFWCKSASKYESCRHGFCGIKVSDSKCSLLEVKHKDEIGFVMLWALKKLRAYIFCLFVCHFVHPFVLSFCDPYSKIIIKTHWAARSYRPSQHQYGSLYL